MNQEPNESTVNAFAKIAIPTATSQQKGLMVVRGKPLFYRKAKVQKALSVYRAMILAGRSRGFRRFHGPVHMEIKFCFSAPKNWGRKRRAAETPKTTRPDLDNMAKVVQDAATKAGIWDDDGQVTELVLRKVYGPEEFVRIFIREVSNQSNQQEESK